MRIWRYVDEVARAGSLRQAAERLNLTPSALQKRVQDVETDLGTPLFERLPKGMRMTAAGEAFVRWIRSQAADLERVQSQIEDLMGLRKGLISIACSQSVASLVARATARFTELHPQVQFALAVRDHAQAIAMLRSYEADLALVFRSGHDRDFQKLASIDQHLVAIMAGGHPLTRRKTLRLNDCAEYPLALLDRSFAARQTIEKMSAIRSGTFFVSLETNSLDVLRTYVAQTMAVAVSVEVELAAAERGAQNDCVVRTIDDRDRPRLSPVLGQLKGRHLSVAAVKFAEQLARRLQDLGGPPNRRPPSRMSLGCNARRQVRT